MAPQVPYNEGVSDVAPDARTPNDYLTVRADPSSFGGQLAQGAEKLGQGATNAAQFFGKVAADDASNQFQDYATKLLHGDPSKTTPGPDGQPIPDTGYLGTRGRQTLDQRPQVNQQLDDKLKELRANLQSPDQQLEFDNFTRRYRSMVDERIGSHADGQQTVWYSSVNTTTAKLAMDHIANNFDNPQEVMAGFQDLTASYVKNAQLQGAQPGDPQYDEAVAAAKRDGLQAQLNAMAVKDPSRAMAILDKNKELAGVKYDDMARQFRSRANQQQGYDVGEQTLRAGYAAQPPAGYTAVQLNQIGAPYGVSGSYLQRTHQIENPENDPRQNSAGAQGPFQFIPETAKSVGLDPKDRNDPIKAAEAAAKLAGINKQQLGQSLGRDPTDAELYLAHQQGASGASLLLSHPNARAGSLVGDAAIRQNGGDPDAPASNFTSMWTAKFNGAPGSAFAARKATAFQAIMSNPDLEPEVRQHALTYVNQQLQAAQIADEQDTKAVKMQNDALQSDFVRKIATGATPDIVTAIANSGLGATEKENLLKFASEYGGIQNDTQYGPGYTQAFKAVMAPADDPSKITDVGSIVARGGPGGDLTKRGVTELLGVMDKVRKQPDQAGINMVKSAQLEYYKNQFAIDQNMNIPGMKPFKNQKGLDKFNHDFVPAFESAYSDWIAKGKDPMEFLNNKQAIDGIMNRVYPASQRAADTLRGDDNEAQKPPPAPDGVDPTAWDRVMTDPPKLAAGGNVPLDKWANAINWLRDNPTPENKAIFDRKMGPSGYTADQILSRMPPGPQADISASGLPSGPITGVAQPAPPPVPHKPHSPVGLFGLPYSLEKVRETNQQRLKDMAAPESLAAGERPL